MTTTRVLPAEPVVPVQDAARPRVLHIITALGTGGAERQLQSLVEYSATESSTIALYGGGVVADAMRAAGHRVDELGLAGLRGPAKLLAFGRLVRLIRARRPDVVHVHLLAAQLWGIPAARLARVPRVVSSEHSLMDTTIENRPLTPMLRRLYRLLEKLTSHTVAVSTTTKSRLVRWGIAADRISVVDNGIDFDALTFSAAARGTSRESWNAGDSTTVVGAVGRLEPVKRFPELMAAIAPWLLQGDRQLVLVGDGPLRASLAELAGRLEITDRVSILGARPDVPALLSGFDVLVSPSRDETFGMAVIEAMGAGLPVVYAQCPALDELPAHLPGAFPLSRFGASSDRSEAAEATAILAGVDAALTAGSALAAGPDVAKADTARRFPLPADLVTAYGIAGTAAALDRLYVGGYG